MKYRKNLGKWGEKVAEDFLIQKGFLITGRNIRTPYGEIDLVGMEGSTLVFIEVKTRTSAESGLPEDSVTPKNRHT